MNTEFKLGTSFQRKVAASSHEIAGEFNQPLALTENPVTNIDNNVM